MAYRPPPPTSRHPPPPPHARVPSGVPPPLPAGYGAPAPTPATATLAEPQSLSTASTITSATSSTTSSMSNTPSSPSFLSTGALPPTREAATSFVPPPPPIQERQDSVTGPPPPMPHSNSYMLERNDSVVGPPPPLPASGSSSSIVTSPLPPPPPIHAPATAPPSLKLAELVRQHERNQSGGIIGFGGPPPITHGASVSHAPRQFPPPPPGGSAVTHHASMAVQPERLLLTPTFNNASPRGAVSGERGGAHMQHANALTPPPLGLGLNAASGGGGSGGFPPTRSGTIAGAMASLSVSAGGSHLGMKSGFPPVSPNHAAAVAAAASHVTHSNASTPLSRNAPSNPSSPTPSEKNMQHQHAHGHAPTTLLTPAELIPVPEDNPSFWREFNALCSNSKLFAEELEEFMSRVFFPKRNGKMLGGSGSGVSSSSGSVSSTSSLASKDNRSMKPGSVFGQDRDSVHHHHHHGKEASLFSLTSNLKPGASAHLHQHVVPSSLLAGGATTGGSTVSMSANPMLQHVSSGSNLSSLGAASSTTPNGASGTGGNGIAHSTSPPPDKSIGVDHQDQLKNRAFLASYAYRAQSQLQTINDVSNLISVLSYSKAVLDEKLESFERYPSQFTDSLAAIQHKVSEHDETKKVVLTKLQKFLGHKVGTNMCWGEGTQMRMMNGEVKCVEIIQRGDRLLGDDGKERLVLDVTKGCTREDEERRRRWIQEEGDDVDEELLSQFNQQHQGMYLITPSSSTSPSSHSRSSWSCNSTHVLVLKFSMIPSEISHHNNDGSDDVASSSWSFTQLTLDQEYGVREDVFTFQTHQQAIDARQAIMNQLLPSSSSSSSSFFTHECTLHSFLSYPSSIQSQARMYQSSIPIHYDLPHMELGERIETMVERDVDEEAVMKTAWRMGVEIGRMMATVSASESTPSRLNDKIQQLIESWEKDVFGGDQQQQQDEINQLIDDQNDSPSTSPPSTTTSSPALLTLLDSYDIFTSTPLTSLPSELLREAPHVRMALLAGVVDACTFSENDGAVTINTTCHHQELNESIVHLARSLGFVCTLEQQKKEEVASSSMTIYLQSSSAEQLLTSCPTDLLSTSSFLSAFSSMNNPSTSHPSSADPHLFSFTITPLPHSSYYGLILTGNQRCLLSDYTITHNSKALEQEKKIRTRRQLMSSLRYDATCDIKRIAQNEELNVLRPISSLLTLYHDFFEHGYKLLSSLNENGTIQKLTTYVSELEQAAEKQSSLFAQSKRQHESQIQTSLDSQSVSALQNSLAGVGTSTGIRDLDFTRSKEGNLGQTKATEKEGYLYFPAPNFAPVFTTISKGMINLNREAQNLPDLNLDLMICTVKENRDAKLRWCFNIISPTETILLQSDSIEGFQEWMNVIQNAISAQLNSGSDTKGGNTNDNKNSNNKNTNSSSSHAGVQHAHTPSIQTSLPSSGYNHGTSPSSSSSPSGSPTDSLALQALRLVEGNDQCAECSAKNPDWISLNLGIVICMECFDAETRVLTNYGYLFETQIRAIIAQQKKSPNSTPLKYACFDVATQQIQYHSGCLVYPENTYGRMVEFDSSSNKDVNVEDEDDASISLRVTPNHDMFVALDSNNKNSSYKKYHAETLLDSSSSMRFLTAASNGVYRSVEDVKQLDNIMSSLCLSTPSSYEHFLTLYGLWLTNGSFDLVKNEITWNIAAAPQADVMSRFVLLGLNSQVRVCEDRIVLHSAIWTQFFATHHPSAPHRIAPFLLRLLDSTQLRSILAGLSIGSMNTDEQGELLLSHEGLCEDLMVLCIQAGYTSHYKPSTLSSTSTPTYRFTYTCHNSSLTQPHLSSSTSQIKQVPYTGKLWCVRVHHSDHLIVAQRAVAATPSSPHSKSSSTHTLSRPLILGQCSGVHRALGVHLSKVRSTTLDKIDAYMLNYLCAVGNNLARSVWEASLQTDAAKKSRPNASSNAANREMFIRGKYELKSFLLPTREREKLTLNRMMFHAIENGLLHKLIEVLAWGAQTAWSNPNAENRTALHQAVMYSNLNIVECVIQFMPDNGSKVMSQKELRGWTPIHYAAYQNDKALVELLLLRGGSSLATELDAAGRTPLVSARAQCEASGEAIVPEVQQMLLAAEEKVKARETRNK